MDRTSQIGVFVCAALLFALYLSSTPPPPAKLHLPAAPAATPAVSTPATTSANPAINSPGATTPTVPAAEKLTPVENPALKVTFTSQGAAIKEVELKQHREGTSGNVVLNVQSKQNVMALTGWPGADTASFEGVENPNGITYTATLPDGVKWERTYAFGKSRDAMSGLGGVLRRLVHHISRMLGKPVEAPLVYTLDVKDVLTNPGATEVVLPSYSLSVGRATPLRVGGHYQPISNMYLGSGWLTSKFHLTTVNDFNPGSIPIIGIPTSDKKDLISSAVVDNAPLAWLGVENQFFTVLLTPATEKSIQHATFQCFNSRDPNGSVPRDAEPDIEAAAFFPEVHVPAGQSVTLSYGLYTGPKEYDRLDALGAGQGELMNYDGMLPFSLLIVPMLTVLHCWYLLFHNYGIAIILLTLMIKAITWPLQSFANRSGKRMQAVAPKLKELQAKYKDQPEKLNTETFAMYREYGVNPFGGCVPALIQMPVFFSLYFMLQNAVELRGQSFLWVHDLTQPDTIFRCTLPFVIMGIGHFALNPLPLMVTGLTMVMMRMTPQIGDPQQAKIAQFMPLIFLFIFYNFAAALSLYYVINNCVSIIQIYRNLRKPLPELKRNPRKKK